MTPERPTGDSEEQGAERGERLAGLLGDANERERRRGQLLAAWRALPLHEQTLVLIEQLRDVLGDERGAPLRQALGLESEPGAEGAEGETIFAVTGVSRGDLRHLNFSAEEIAKLDDGDMARIARQLEDHYVEMGFWDDLEFLARRIIDAKK